MAAAYASSPTTRFGGRGKPATRVSRPTTRKPAAVSREVPRASTIRTRSPVSTERSSAVAASTRTPCGSARRGGHRRLRGAIGEGRVGEPRHPAEGRGIDRRQIRPGSPVGADQHRVLELEHDGGHAGHAADAQLATRIGRPPWRRALDARRDAQVGADDEARVGALGRVVGGDEGAQARAERDHQRERDDARGKLPRAPFEAANQQPPRRLSEARRRGHAEGAARPRSAAEPPAARRRPRRAAARAGGARAARPSGPRRPSPAERPALPCAGRRPRPARLRPAGGRRAAGAARRAALPAPAHAVPGRSRARARAVPG